MAKILKRMLTRDFFFSFISVCSEQTAPDSVGHF